MPTAMPANLHPTAHRGYLTNAEVDRLIGVVQDGPYDDDTDTYTSTDVTDDALAQLTDAFLPVIHKVARLSTVLDPDDALMTCLEEFVSIVRRYELGSALPFKAGLRTMLTRRLGDVGRTSGLIAVKGNAAARYRQLMDRHEWDLEAAYAECVNTSNGFTPSTFLAITNALSVDSLERNMEAANGTGNHAYTGTAMYNPLDKFMHDSAPTPEDQTVQTETVRWLFTQVDDQDSNILHLAYGFTDLHTENLRLAAGFRADGSPLSDREVAQVLGLRVASVNRYRNATLMYLRDLLTEDDGE